MAIARAKGLSDEKSVVPYRLHGRFRTKYFKTLDIILICPPTSLHTQNGNSGTANISSGAFPSSASLSANPGTFVLKEDSLFVSYFGLPLPSSLTTVVRE